MIKNRLVLIDAFALIYRAFYGMPMALTHDGHPINAAYGFTSAVLAAIKELQPEYLAAGFDLPKPTKRKIEYVEYKAHRKPMPDDLIPQIQYCREILKAMNIPIVSAEGYEGEDIIATIITQIKTVILTLSKAKWKNLKAKGDPSVIPQDDKTIENIIVTGDSDTFQLIDDNTRVYSMARGANQAVMYDIDKVKERYGLEPSQFVDFKALKGDASDNIPGVPGIGEKGAAKLIQEFGSLENIYSVILNGVPLGKAESQGDPSIAPLPQDDISKKSAKNTKISEKVIRLLTENKEQAYLSQKLSQIQNDAPVEFNLPDAKVHDYDVKKVTKLFNDLGFKSLIGRLPIAERTNNQQALF